MNKLLLIDGNSLINRAYYAFGASGAELSYDGNPTAATYGFINMLLKGIETIKPTHLVVAFDVRAKTFRHKMYDGYKATRKGMPDDLAVQLNDLKFLLRGMNITVAESEGYEADDIIGTLSSASEMQTVILTADRDAFQLVSDTCELHLTKSGVTALDVWDMARVRAEYGIEPHQMIEIKALAGDTSDNIPGAMGIGEKTALTMIRDHGNIETLYENIDTIRGAARDKLIACRDNVFLSRELATINLETPLNFKIANTTFSMNFPQSLIDEFAKRGFRSIIKKLGATAPETPATVAETKIEITTITENPDLDKFINAKRIAINHDTMGFYLATDDSHEYHLPIRHTLLDAGFDPGQLTQMLKPVFESAVPKHVFDSKGLKELLANYDITLNNVTIDAKICHHLLTSTTTPPTFADNTRVAQMLSTNYMERLRAIGAWGLYADIELPLVDVLLEMQQNGAYVALEALNEVAVELEAEIAIISEQIYTAAGERFNLNSPKMLSDVLYKKLGLTTLQKTKTGFSTNEEVLQKLYNKHPIIPPLLRYRKLFKLLSTYIHGYRNQMTSAGLIHSKFNNTATVTGRLSSSEPNLQNIPVRSDDGARVRKLFRSRFDGGRLVCADYNQIELRVLAHLSNDSILTDGFRMGRDIHTETAAKVFDVDPANVTADMRRIAKTINFGIIYGMSSFGLSQSIHITPAEATHFINKYFAQFVCVKKFLDDIRDNAIANGYVTTLLGRRRYFPELKSKNAQVVQFGMRAAMNMPMQGSAADIIKAAMVRIHKRMRAEGLKTLLIAQIHDELVFDTPADEIELMRKLLHDEMESETILSVPLVVDIKAKETL
ncbi:MAG: DNA polymerase I [Firmicutes bacterium]|nr:DNA polymerase I [Bacillota bacterium]